MIPIPNILDRSENYATLQFKNDEDILAYRIRCADTLDNAYGTENGVVGSGTEAIFDVLRGQTLRTKAIRDRGLGISGDNTRGQTRATFDPGEFFGQAAQVPPDSNIWYMRVQVSTVATAAAGGSVPGGFPLTANNTNQSKILVMRNPTFRTVPRPALSVGGTAPASAAAVLGGPPPPESLVLSFPAFADGMVISNLDAVTPLFFATGQGQGLFQVAPSQSISLTTGMKEDLYIVSTGNPEFSLVTSTVTGLR
jgi:hypothetical protein